jgi:hypothetical protein
MTHHIHRGDTFAGPRYRVWSTNLDRYLTPPIVRHAAAAWLRAQPIPRGARSHADFDRDIESRLARADASGTSQRMATRATGAWETERCSTCQSFHHEYCPKRGGRGCSVCGEPATVTAHQAPCRTTP